MSERRGPCRCPTFFMQWRKQSRAGGLWQNDGLEGPEITRATEGIDTPGPQKAQKAQNQMRNRALAITSVLFAATFVVAIGAQAPQPTAAPTAKPEEGIPVTD